MSTIPPTRINAIEAIETALRVLVAHGYEAGAAGWREHEAWLATLERRTPTEFDFKWATRAPSPTAIAEHLQEKHVYMIPVKKEDGRTFWIKNELWENETLKASNCFAGRNFTLSPGQRQVLRERHGLTPSHVVEVTNVTTFPAPNAHVMVSFTLKSAVHVDPRRRAHVLNEVVISNAAQFFAKAEESDKAREAEAAYRAEKRDAEVAKKGGQPKSSKARAMMYYE